MEEATKAPVAEAPKTELEKKLEASAAAAATVESTPGAQEAKSIAEDSKKAIEDDKKTTKNNVFRLTIVFNADNGDYHIELPPDKMIATYLSVILQAYLATKLVPPNMNYIKAELTATKKPGFRSVLSQFFGSKK